MADGENGVSAVAIGSVPPSPVWRSSREMPNCRAFCRAGRRTPQMRDCLAGIVEIKLMRGSGVDFQPDFVVRRLQTLYHRRAQGSLTEEPMTTDEITPP